MSHIHVRNLSITYGRHNALRDITLDIPDQQLTAIIGPSGCGKTTLLKSINRLTDLCDDVKVDGTVLIDGENVHAPNADVLALREKVGFMSQQPYPLPMSIYDNIAFGPRIHGVSESRLAGIVEDLKVIRGDALPPEGQARRIFRSRKNENMDLLVEYYLRLAGLWDEVKGRLRSPASKLSIGQQQRLALARTLGVGPEVILADEPTSALDPISAKLIERQFQLLKERYTIVVVTHILRQARRIADYLAFIYMGELVEHGPAEQIFLAPRDERTSAYIAGSIS